jgi:predicted metal-dependent hydrolase
MRTSSKPGLGGAAPGDVRRTGSRGLASAGGHISPESPVKPQQLSLLDLTEPLIQHPLKDEQDFIAELAAMVPHPVRIRLTRNRSNLISVMPRDDGSVDARFQHAFRAADVKTMKALARFMYKPDKRSRKRIDRFIDEKFDLIEAMSREAPAERRPAVAAGENHDLKKVLSKVMRTYGIRLKGIRIKWSSRAPGRGARYSIKFGSYCHETKTIAIHPDLDSPDVPDYFVEFIVYHELCHVLFLPIEEQGKRREVHTEEFKRFERKFYNYEQALKFEEWFVKNKLG